MMISFLPHLCTAYRRLGTSAVDVDVSTMIFRAEMRRIASRDSESDGGPPSPGSYILPLLVIVVLCAGYVWYSRRKRRDASFE